MTCVAFSIEFAKTNYKIAENSEIILWKLFIVIHYYSFVSLVIKWYQADLGDNTRDHDGRGKSGAIAALRGLGGTDAQPFTFVTRWAGSLY